MSAKSPPLVSIRAVREAQKLSTRQLADRITERGIGIGVTVGDTSTIRNIELGHQRPSKRLMGVWAEVLGLHLSDVVLPAPPPGDSELDAAAAA